MNTYNDNLRNGVVSSLNAQELQLTQKKAQLNAAMFSLYYAEGALFTAGKDTNEAQASYVEKLDVEKQAINNSDISNSLLATVKLENAYVAQAASNAAVAAANVQIAANAIVLLASDVGSIFSIINASDYGTDIYDQGKYAKDLIDETAYLAEQTSRSSMQASQLTAEVSAVAVQNSATITNNSVTSLFDIAATDLKNAEDLLSAKNEIYATTSAAEKVAEGNLEDINVGYYATESSYNLSNKDLNLNLKAKQDKAFPLKYIVSFDYFQSPFAIPDEEIWGIPIERYPVKDYYIMLVKNKNKSTFSMANAENLLLFPEDELMWKKVDSWHVDDGSESNTELSRKDILDSDGEEMKVGEEYVVFVLAVFQDRYKKELNNYSDYLTAPSLSFNLTYQLAEANTLVVQERMIEVDIDIELRKDPDIEVETEIEQYLTFKVNKNPDYPVEYRCMFLPVNCDVIKGLLTNPEIRKFATESENCTKICYKYDSEIAKTKTEIRELGLKIEELSKKVIKNRNVHQRLEKDADGYEKLALSIEKNKTNRDANKEQIRLLKVRLSELETQKIEELLTPILAESSRCGFIFNLTIAEQVSFANYTLALLNENPQIINLPGIETSEEEVPKIKKKGKEAKEKPLKLETPIIGLETPLTDLIPPLVYEMIIRPETTDNYGNRLTNGKKYIPVVLSYSDAVNKKEYTNALSDFQNTADFEYKREAKTKLINV